MHNTRTFNNTRMSWRKAATCLEAGYTDKEYCELCSLVTKDSSTIEPLGHSLIKHNAIEATCTSAGMNEYFECNRCNLLFTNEKCTETIDDISVLNIPVTPHQYDDWVTSIEPTCIGNGEKIRTCAACKNTEYETLPKEGHVEKTIEGKAATCTEPGKEAVMACTRCEDTVGGELIESTGHEATTRGIKEPTCTEEGYTGDEICVICGETLQNGETIASSGHSFGEWEEISSPNCNDKGSKKHTCQVCGFAEAADIDANGHRWKKDFVTDVEPSCITEGCKTIHCLDCDAIKESKTIPAKGHSFETVLTKATAKTSGKIEKVCKECHYTELVKEISFAKTMKLGTTACTYNGKVKAPAVTVETANGNTLVKDTDYTVSYANGRKSVGTYKVTVKGKGNYSFAQTLYFKINPVKTDIKSLTKGTKAFTVKWAKKTAETTGYQIQYSTSSAFKTGKATKLVTVKSNKTTSKTIKSLKAKKKYYVRVRTYKTVGSTKYYSSWCTKKTVITR